MANLMSTTKKVGGNCQSFGNREREVEVVQWQEEVKLLNEISYDHVKLIGEQ